MPGRDLGTYTEVACVWYTANGEPLQSNNSSGEGFDVIGDVHGYGDHLEGLLRQMGYIDNGTSFAHPARRVVFVGDLVDRGPGQIKTITIARSMVASGAAKIVLGNHEINAIGYTLPNPELEGDYIRVHSERNKRTHQAFLSQLVEGSAEHHEAISWFRSLPVWLDLDGLRVAHACWHQESIDILRNFIGPNNSISHKMLVAAPGSLERQALSTLTRGPEVRLPQPYINQSGGQSRKARFRWWSEEATTMDKAIRLPDGARAVDGSPYPNLDAEVVDAPVEIYSDAVPILFGHYWWRGAPARITPYIGCVDYSVAGGGPLVAYRWQGESELKNEHFVQFSPAVESIAAT